MQQASQEKIFSKGKLFELVHLAQKDGRIFEVARRAPGVRLIIADHGAQKVLLTKEYRRELNGYDFRLPGGKVFDTLDEYEQHRRSGDNIQFAAENKAKAEGLEEAGVKISRLKLFRKSTLGATVEWDLYVFEAIEWSYSDNGQQLEEGEDIEADIWFTYDKVETMILEGKMQEERIALTLLQWIHEQRGRNEV